jgi:hypothetical protein
MSYAQAQNSNFIFSNVTTNHMTTSFNHTLAIEKQLSQYYLNYTQIKTTVNLAKNTSQFQSLVNGYNYTFDGIFEYLNPDSQIGSKLMIYAVDFSLYKDPVGTFPSAVKVITVWMDPALKIYNITSSGMGWIGGPGGPALPIGLESLCGKSDACYLRYFTIPPEAVSICDTTSGCYEIGPSGHFIYFGQLTVPEFPFAIVPLVIAFASLLVFYRIKLKI